MRLSLNSNCEIFKYSFYTKLFFHFMIRNCLIFMLFMNSIKYNIINCFKIFNQYLLSFLLVFTGLNLDEHAHHFEEGYGICNQGCDSAEHHDMHNDCEECINSSGKQKFFINVQNVSNHYSSSFAYKNITSSFIKSSSHRSSSSRAPPTNL